VRYFHGTSIDDFSLTRKISCRLCRQRKTRCDRRKPRCGHCFKAGADCEYVSKQKKRGLRAGYVAELERRLGELCRAFADDIGLKGGSSDVVEQELQQLKQNQAKPGNELLPGTDSQAPSPWETSHRTYSRVEEEAELSSGMPGHVTYRHDDPTRLELQHLSPAMMNSLCEVWFKEYQPWCPMLDRHQIAASLQNVSSHPGQGMDITLKALLCLTVSHSSQAISLGYDGRRRLSQHLRSEVILEAMRMSRNQSLQALLIIVIYHYGYGNLSEAWNLLSICKRMCVSLGLRKHLLSRKFDWQDEGSRMSWLTAAMESTSTLGASWDVELAKVGEPINKLPSLIDADIIATSLVENLNLTVISLHPIHNFHRNNHAIPRQESTSDQLSICERLYQDLTLYRQHSHRDGSISSYAFAPDGSIAFDPNKVLTNIITNTAIIALYQPYTVTSLIASATPTPQPPLINHQTHPQSHSLHQTATHRCLDAANEMSKIISTIADADIEFICPFLGSFIFTAARFSLVFSRQERTTTARSTGPSTPSTNHTTMLNNNGNTNSINAHATSSPLLPYGTRTPGFDLLMHALNMCGRRWPLARRLDIVLRAALVEDSKPKAPASSTTSAGLMSASTSAIPHAPLPKEFYDLRLSSLDVDDVLSEWVEGMKSTVYVGSLNGPYA
jgi:Fungal Zn(2)-Cys(6) binuclear cluster domain/Fungal specific transcription factor domain